MNAVFFTDTHFDSYTCVSISLSVCVCTYVHVCVYGEVLS